MDFKYKTTFANSVFCVPSEEDTDKFLSKASLDQLKALVPDEVFGRGRRDLLPIAGNLAVVNLKNLNDDAIATETIVEMADSLKFKYINVEHMRAFGAVGHVVDSAFSAFDLHYKSGFGSEILSTADVNKKNEPFNFAYAGVLYRVIAGEELIDKVIDASDPTSSNYLNVSSSWEVGFSRYSIAIGGPILKNARIIKPEEDDFEEFDEILRANGGEGKKGEDLVYRVIEGSGKDLPIFLGGALTNNPAASVAGVVVVESKEDKEVKVSEAPHHPEKHKHSKDKASEDDITPASGGDDEVVLSEEITDLIEERVKLSVSNFNQKEKRVMKIRKLDDINDENLKEAEASQVRKWIEDQIQDESEKYSKQVKEKDDALTQTKADHEKLVTEHNQLKTKSDDLEKQLGDLNSKIEAQEQQEKFNQRMASFEEQYDLTADDRKVICDSIKGADDEAFAQFEATFKVLARDRVKKEEEAEETSEASEQPAQEAKASTEEPKENKENEEQVVSEAVDNSEKEKEVPNSTETAPQTLQEKFAGAFDKDAFKIKDRY